MKRLTRRFWKIITGLLASVRAGAGSLAFTAGIGMIAASAFTISVSLGLLVGGLLLAGGAVFWERGDAK